MDKRSGVHCPIFNPFIDVDAMIDDNPWNGKTAAIYRPGDRPRRRKRLNGHADNQSVLPALLK